jgi:HlyD family secretion protein
MRRWLIRLLILGVVAGVAAAVVVPVMNWWREASVPRYSTAKVSRGHVETVVNSTGTVKPVRTVSVGASTSGPIEKVLVDYNSVVYKKTPDLPATLLALIDPQVTAVATGTVTLVRPATLLALIDPQLAQAALDRDRAALKRDKAALETQEADLKRVKALCQQAKNNEDRACKLVAINKDYLSETDMDQYKFTHITSEAQVALSEANVDQAKANVALSEANVKNSETNLGYTKIYAPEDGVVIERKVDPGQTVAASFQTPELFTIALEMDRHMYVFASVDEADIGQIKSAMERNRARPEKERKRLAKFTVDAYPGELFEGDVYDVRQNATTTQNVVTYPVVIDAPNRDRKLMPSMTANISFEIEAKDDVLRVPIAALRFVPTPMQVRPEDRHYLENRPSGTPEAKATPSAGEKAEQTRNRQHRVVWVHQDGPLLRAVPVTLGLIENQFAELVDGDLAEDDAVVTGTENANGPR